MQFGQLVRCKPVIRLFQNDVFSGFYMGLKSSRSFSMGSSHNNEKVSC